MTHPELGLLCSRSEEPLVHAGDRRRLEPDEPANDAEEVLDEHIQLPLDGGGPQLDAEALKEAELLDREPEFHDPDYEDLLDSGWIDRAAYIEELDDDRGNSLDVGVTLDLNDSDQDEELGQMVDLDVGALLTPLPKETESERDATRDSPDPSFAIGALRDLLLPDESDAEVQDGERVDDERFPAFDAASVPTSSRTGDDEASDDEGIANDDA